MRTQRFKEGGNVPTATANKSGRQDSTRVAWGVSTAQRWLGCSGGSSWPSKGEGHTTNTEKLTPQKTKHIYKLLGVPSCSLCSQTAVSALWQGIQREARWPDEPRTRAVVSDR